MGEEAPCQRVAGVLGLSQCAGIYCNVHCTSGINPSNPELVILIGWYLQIEHKGAMKQLVFYFLPWNVELCKAIFIC